MADLATPSAAAMGTSGIAASEKPAASKETVARPERPDEESYKTELAKAEKELKESQDRLTAIKAKLDQAKPSNQDSPANQRRTELRDELTAIREQQQSGKSSRSQIMNQIKRRDEQLKATMNEDKTARSKTKYKSADEIQNEIDRLQRQVDTGTMKIVDEKKALSEVSALHKLKKGFGALEEYAKRIEDLKAQIAELRKSLDDPETKAMSDRYKAITTELDKIKAEQDHVYKNVNTLRDERTAMQKEQQEKWQAIRDLKDNHYKAKRLYAEYEKQAYNVRREKHKTEREAFEKQKRRQHAQQKLDDASAPAYQSEMIATQGLIRYLDPTSTEAKTATEPSKFAAQATRTVAEAPIQGTRLPRKGEDADDLFTGLGTGKKSKKSKKDASSDKFLISMGVIEEFAKVGVEPPMNKSDVPNVLEQLRDKLKAWKDDQDRKTKENITKAQHEIDRLEAEAAEPATNGETDAVAGATKGVEETKLTDTTEQPAA